MTNCAVDTNEEVEARVIRLAERPIVFETFLNLNINSDMELIDGVLVKKLSAQWDHERLLVWLVTLLNAFTRNKKLGSVAASRMTVKIDEYRGRLPDLLFVRQERVDIIQQKALYAAPDLIIELISPNDRPSDMIALETDYRAIGVQEIVFIDQHKQRVRILRKREADYEETELDRDRFELETVAGFSLQVEWLFDSQRPDEFDLLSALLKA